MGSEKTPLTDAVCPHLNLSHGGMRAAASALRDHARRIEYALAVAEEALRSAAGSLQIVYAYGAAAQAREALRAIEKIKGGE